MSDNPSGDNIDILGLGVKTDEASFAQAQSAVKAFQDQVAQSMGRAAQAMLAGDEAAAKLYDNLLKLANESGDLNAGFNNNSASVEAANKQLAAMSAQFDTLISGEKSMATAAQEATAAINEQAAAAEKMQAGPRLSAFRDAQNQFRREPPPPAADPEMPDAPGEPNKTGSAFGIGHALSVAGHATGSPMLRDAGAFVYMEEGLKRAVPFLENFNLEITKQPGIIGPAIGGLTALGVPMAGLAVVAVPVAAAVIGVTLAVQHFNQVIAAAQGTLNQSLEVLDAYFKAIDNGTTETLQREINEQEKRRNSANTEYGVIAQAFKGSGGNLDVVNAAVKGFAIMFGSFDEMNKHLDKLAAEGAKAQAVIDGDTQALGSNNIAFNNAAESARRLAASIVETSQRYADYDKLTVQGVKDRLDVLQREGAAAEAAKAAVEAHNDELKIGPEQYQKNIEAINGYQATIDQSKADIEHLTGASYGWAQARKEEADAMAAEQAILQERLNFFATVGKLRATGTASSYESEVGSLQGKKEGDLGQIAYLEGKGALTDQEQKQLTKLKAEIEEIDKQLEFLSRDVKLWIDAREAEGAITKADTALAKETAAAEKQAKQATAENIRREAQAEAELSRGSLQDTEARYQIATKESREEIKIKQDTADKILDIATKVGQQEDDAHKTLARKQEDDLTKFYNDRAKLERDANNQASEDAVEHAARVRDIQRQSHSDETSALLNRDFLSLMKSRQKDQDDLTKEDQSYNAREQKLSRHLQQQENELQIRLQQEDAQARVAFNRKIEDIVQNANREIEQQHVAEQRKIQQAQQAQHQQLEDLAHTEDYKIRLLRHNQAIELQLIADQERQRLAIANATNVAIVNAANRTIDQIAQHQPGAAEAARGSGAQRSRYAGGGAFGADNSFEMSEFGPETLSFGRDSYVIPGQAIVYPMQSGSVTPGTGGGKNINFAPVINIDGRGKSDNELADMLEDRMLTLLEHIHGE